MATHVATDELYLEHLAKLRNEVERKTGKSPAQLVAEREKRFNDALLMKVPDRVPIILGGNYFAAKYVGLPYSTVYYDAIAWKAAYAQMLVDFQPDYSAAAVGLAASGAVLETLQSKNALWPGGTLPPDQAQQHVDAENMKEDEYDLFLNDTTDFILRRYLPRVYGALEPLAKLPSLGDRFIGIPAMTGSGSISILKD